MYLARLCYLGTLYINKQTFQIERKLFRVPTGDRLTKEWQYSVVIDNSCCRQHTCTVCLRQRSWKPVLFSELIMTFDYVCGQISKHIIHAKWRLLFICAWTPPTFHKEKQTWNHHPLFWTFLAPWVELLDQRWVPDRPTFSGFGSGCEGTHPDQLNESPIVMPCLQILYSMGNPLMTATGIGYRPPGEGTEQNVNAVPLVWKFTPLWSVFTSSGTKLSRSFMSSTKPQSTNMYIYVR